MGPDWLEVIVVRSEDATRVVYCRGRTIFGGGTGSPSFQPAGKTAPRLTTTAYSPGNNFTSYSPAGDKTAVTERPLEG